ncbi:Protein CBG21956 [Caenorhabditis briggsae]|uniref:Protein CBG21956 n=1 Tax=Caenorhabditis briggsae TaxID=6238 RepID=A8Y151_CAEBR|nr:Protein CBG21956 [Caenorhabditis briggsae]CAP38612.2 Protein CBG21956 [Caenorhabditis briggsae]
MQNFRFFFQDNEFEKTRAKYEQMSGDVIFKDLKKLTPISWDKNEDETMRLANFVTHANDSRQKSIIFAQLAVLSVNSIRAVERVWDYRGEMFVLHGSIRNNRKKITVRVFEDGKERFVMNKELVDAFIASGFPCSPIGGDYCYTTAMRDVYREYKHYIQNIEFIRYPITRAKHRATPVKAPNIDGAESLVILAIDAFFEIFRYSIFRLKLLQLESKGFELLKQMIPVFLQLNDNSNTVYFIPLLMFDEFEKRYHKEINNLHSSPLTDVLDVGTDGFTVENLKEELAKCGLTRYCPEAIEHAEAVYSEVNRIKKEGILRTCDMFDAIEHCSLLCVLGQLPELKIFVHQQKGCHRVLSYTCDYCDGLPRIPEKTQMTIGGFFKAMTSISKVLEILSTHKKNQKASEEKKATLAILEDVELKKREKKERKKERRAQRKKEEKLKISALKNEGSEAEKTSEDTQKTSETIIDEQPKNEDSEFEKSYKNLKNDIQKILKASSLLENIPGTPPGDSPGDPEPTVPQKESKNCENCENARKSQKSAKNWQAEKQGMQLRIQEFQAENDENQRMMIQQLLDELDKNQ